MENQKPSAIAAFAAASAPLYEQLRTMRNELMTNPDISEGSPYRELTHTLGNVMMIVSMVKEGYDSALCLKRIDDYMPRIRKAETQVAEHLRPSRTLDGIRAQVETLRLGHS